MPTANDVYKLCMQENGNNASAVPTCTYAAQQYDPNFKPTGTGAGGGFWSDPNNIVNLLGSAGTATGQWLDAFGVASPTPTSVVPAPAKPKTPTWVWVLVAVMLIAIIFLLIFLFR